MFCLCSKEPRESTSFHSQPCTASPSAPVQIRAPRLPAPHLLAEPSTPPGEGLRPALQTCANPAAYLIPRIPGFEGLVDPGTDSDDGPPCMTSASKALQSSGLLTPKSARGSIKTSALSPLSMLKSRMKALRHFPSSDLARCRALSAASDKGDNDVVARRAEVRQIAHKMIQEELQKEQHPQPTHVYRKTAMSTIREDPSDIASSCGGPSRDVTSCCNKIVKKNGQYGANGNSECGCSHVPGDEDEEALKTLEAAKSPRSFQPRVSLPRGLKIGSRFRGAVGEKRWRRAVLVKAGSQQSSEVATLDGGTETSALPFQRVSPIGSPQEINGMKPSVSCESCFVARLGSDSASNTPVNTVAPSGQAISTSGGKCSAISSTGSASLLCPGPVPAPHHVGSSSGSLGSLGSLDEDGSVHEAREAHIVATGSPIPRASIDAGFDRSQAAPDESGLRSSCLLCIAANVNLHHANHRSGPSVASHISTLNLPSPVVGPDSLIDGKYQQTSSSDNHKLAASGNFLSLKSGGVDSKSFSPTVPHRRGSTGFPIQFRSLSRLGMTKGMKTFESDANKQSSGPAKSFRSRSTDAQRFPESWWKATPDTMTEPIQRADRTVFDYGEGIQAQPASPGGGDKVAAPENTASEPSGLPLSSSRAMSASWEKIFKVGVNKLTTRKQSFIVSQPQNEISPAYCSQGNDAHASDANLENVVNLQEAEASSTKRQSLCRTSTSSSLSASHDDMISDIDSVFGVLISVDNGQEKEGQPSSNAKTNANTGAGTTGTNTIVADKDKAWLPLTAPSTPVSNAYAEVRAYIITNFSENTATASARKAIESGGASDLCEPFQTLAPVPHSDVKNEDSISIKSDSAHILKKQGSSLPPAKYMTWNGPAKAQQGPMRSTLEFSWELEQVFQGERGGTELLSGRTLFPFIKYG